MPPRSQQTQRATPLSGTAVTTDAAPEGKKASQRRTTIANANQFEQEPASASADARKTVTARHSMPSKTAVAAPSTPRASSGLSQTRLASHDSPRRTPGGSLAATAARRFEDLREYGLSLIEFYDKYVDFALTGQGDFDGDMSEQLDRSWGMLYSNKKHQVYPTRDNKDAFLTASTVLKENGIDSEPDLEREMHNNINIVNRATFVHFVAQIPLRLAANDSSWTVDRLVELMVLGDKGVWPIIDLQELILCQKNFFSKIAPQRLKVPYTLDDLNLYLDLSVQIAIHRVEHFANDNVAHRKRINFRTAMEGITSEDNLVTALHESTAGAVDEATLEKLLDAYQEAANQRVDVFVALQYDVNRLREAFPFLDTVVSFVRYIVTLNTVGLTPLADSGEMIIPRRTDHIFSMSLRRQIAQQEREIEAEGAPRAANQFEVQLPQEGQNGDALDAEETDAAALSKTSRQVLRFNQNNQLVQMDVEEDEAAPSIVRNRGVVESVRDTALDEGDADPFLSQLIRASKRGNPAKKRNLTRGGKGTSTAAALAMQPEVVVESIAGETSQAGNVNYGEDEHNAEDAVDSENLADATLTTKPKRRTQRKGKGKQKETVRAPSDDFEVNQEQIDAEQSESVHRRKKGKAKAQEEGAENEQQQDDGDEEYQLPGASSSRKRAASASQGEEGSQTTVKVKKHREYRYATGGNQKGRSRWTEEEKDCLLAELRALYPLYQQALQDRRQYNIWKEILLRHGLGGRLSMVLKNRNNVQLKDKARNEFEARSRAGQPIPAWLMNFG